MIDIGRAQGALEVCDEIANLKETLKRHGAYKREQGKVA